METEIEWCWLSEVDSTPPKFPKVAKRGRKLFLRLEDGRDYPISEDPMKVLGLLHHMAEKGWPDSEFFFHAIGRIAGARGWGIHPFQD